MRRDVYQAIADPIRRDIIKLLMKDTMNINEVAKNYEISRPAVSKHLKILNECGIININKKGRERLCKVKPKMLKPAHTWIDQYKELFKDNKTTP
ncbi:MAG: winged helix-turn-helix transcriptional regulator [Flavobacteriaceae bacterium]